MATYSAFFSSGLLAPRNAGCAALVFPSSPMTSPVDPVDRQLSLPSTPVEQISTCPKALEASTNPERPRMRRRRSSINVGANPMALIKSPVRNASAALQRTGLMSPTRHRAASIGVNEALDNNSLFGRLRSGSIGGVANLTKRPRREIRLPVPLASPPNAPLPALPPPSPTAMCGSSLLPPAFMVSVQRQPLKTRTSFTDNVGSFFSSALPSPTLLGPDYVPCKLSPSLSGFPGFPEDAIDEVMKEV